MEPVPKVLEELQYLASKRHKWYRNTFRTDLADSPDEVIQKGTLQPLKVGI